MTQSRTDTNFTETDREREAGSRTRSSSTTTTAHATGHILSPLDYEAIRTMYVDVLGPLNRIKARDIEVAIANGLQASAILDALYETALAARPSHQYMRAILRRYVSFGIYTAEDAEKDREQFRAQREASNREKWGAWYKDPTDDMPFALEG